MSKLKNGISLAVAATLFAMAIGSAVAESQFAQTHPRRAEVNGRLANQDRRINQERRSGQITQSQAQALHKDDRQIRGEERSMAAQDGGHITAQERRTLNQQENGVSKQIGR